MLTKTFKIGEYCKGGIITVEIKDNSNFPNAKVIDIIGKEWDLSKGTSRMSCQCNAKEWTRLTVVSSDETAKRKADEFLNDLTTSYYTDEIIKWIETKVKFETSFRW